MRSLLRTVLIVMLAFATLAWCGAQVSAQDTPKKAKSGKGGGGKGKGKGKGGNKGPAPAEAAPGGPGGPVAPEAVPAGPAPDFQQVFNKALTKATDPKMKEALSQIEGKLINIREIIIGEIKVTSKDPAGKPQDVKIEFVARRPGQVFIHGSKADGQSPTWVVYNGKMFWAVTQAPPGPGAPAGVAPPLTATQLDMEKLVTAFAPVSKTSIADQMMIGLNSAVDKLDLSGIKLAEDTASDWTFESDVDPSKMQSPGIPMPIPGLAPSAPGAKAAPIKVRVTFDKLSGFLKKITVGDMATVTFDKVQINPLPPIPEAYFTYTPPPGVKINDMTGQALMMGAMMQQQAGGMPGAPGPGAPGPGSAGTAPAPPAPAPGN